MWSWSVPALPACTADTLFARRGLNAALVARSADFKAYKRVCTHFIQASAVPAGKRLPPSIYTDEDNDHEYS